MGRGAWGVGRGAWSVEREGWGVICLSSHSLATDYCSRATLLSPHAPGRRPEIGFVFRLDSAFVRPKSQNAND